jgi:hydrogenase-4 component H
MFLPKLREIKEALSSFFSAPYTTKFPKEGFTAVPEFRGFPEYHEDKCVGCGTCVQVCPAEAIELVDDPKAGKRTLTVNYFHCMNCGQCEEKCITGEGIILVNTYSFSSADKQAAELFNSVEKELLICEVCGAIIACTAHLNFIKERLGAKAYAHPNLLIETQRLFTQPGPANPKSRVRREDLIKEVCPKCRHKIVVADEF